MDALDSILFLTKVSNSQGHLYLSKICGSGNKIFQQVEDIADAIVEYFSPRCNTAFCEVGTCECMASKIILYLNDGGYVEGAPAMEAGIIGLSSRTSMMHS